MTGEIEFINNLEGSDGGPSAVLSRLLPGRTDENREKSISECPMSRPRLEP
jgi:hypothetical protein